MEAVDSVEASNVDYYAISFWEMGKVFFLKKKVE